MLCKCRYYIFASMWGHKVYTIYSILFIVFIILLIVTAFITVALTYFQLAVEDHRWWWRSFLCGGSTGPNRSQHNTGQISNLCVSFNPMRSEPGVLFL